MKNKNVAFIDWCGMLKFNNAFLYNRICIQRERQTEVMNALQIYMKSFKNNFHQLFLIGSDAKIIFG